jgi:hypothetical protein
VQQDRLDHFSASLKGEIDVSSSEIEHHASPLILAGMHRSGTSLTASMLMESGVDMGERLMGAGPGNPKGHFENIDFVSFHEELLLFHGLDSRGFDAPVSVEVPDSFHVRASELVTVNGKSGAWGWKDPRVCMFLEFWSAFLPSAKFICVFRSPWQVMSSMIRRRTDANMIENPALILNCWKRYNQALLRLCEKFPDRTILLDVDTVIHDWQQVSRLVVEKFAVNLRITAELAFDGDLFKSEAYPPHLHSLIENYFSPINQVWQKLRDSASLMHACSRPQPVSEVDLQRLILRDVSRYWLLDESLPRSVDAEVGDLIAQLAKTRTLETHLPILTEKLEAQAQEIKELTLSNAEQSKRAEVLENARISLAERCDELVEKCRRDGELLKRTVEISALQEDELARLRLLNEELLSERRLLREILGAAESELDGSIRGYVWKLLRRLIFGATKSKLEADLSRLSGISG